MAPCLFRDLGNGYYAVVRRSGKIVRKSSETDRLEIAKRELRDFQNGVKRIGISAHNRRFGETIDEFVSSRTGASATLHPYGDIAKRIKATWPGSGLACSSTPAPETTLFPVRLLISPPQAEEADQAHSKRTLRRGIHRPCQHQKVTAIRLLGFLLLQEIKPSHDDS